MSLIKQTTHCLDVNKKGQLEFFFQESPTAVNLSPLIKLDTHPNQPGQLSHPAHFSKTARETENECGSEMERRE